MTKAIAKSKRAPAERAAEWVLRKVYGCVATRRALRTHYAKVDMFGCDVVGVDEDGWRTWVQVTAGQTSAVTARRRKLEAYPWHVTDGVYVWQLQSRQSGRKKEWYFNVWEYEWCSYLGPKGQRHWIRHGLVTRIKPEWFKAYKEAK